MRTGRAPRTRTGSRRRSPGPRTTLRFQECPLPFLSRSAQPRLPPEKSTRKGRAAACDWVVQHMVDKGVGDCFQGVARRAHVGEARGEKRDDVDQTRRRDRVTSTEDVRCGRLDFGNCLVVEAQGDKPDGDRLITKRRPEARRQTLKSAEWRLGRFERRERCWRFVCFVPLHRSFRGGEPVGQMAMVDPLELLELFLITLWRNGRCDAVWRGSGGRLMSCLMSTKWRAQTSSRVPVTKAWSVDASSRSICLITRTTLSTTQERVRGNRTSQECEPRTRQFLAS